MQHNEKKKRLLKKYVIASAKFEIQDVITNVRTRLKLTTVLYLNPNNRAKSLSTLIAVNVVIDSPHKRALEMYAKVSDSPQNQFHFLLAIVKR